MNIFVNFAVISGQVKRGRREQNSQGNREDIDIRSAGRAQLILRIQVMAQRKPLGTALNLLKLPPENCQGITKHLQYCNRLFVEHFHAIRYE